MSDEMDGVSEAVEEFYDRLDTIQNERRTTDHWQRKLLVEGEKALLDDDSVDPDYDKLATKEGRVSFLEGAEDTQLDYLKRADLKSDDHMKNLKTLKGHHGVTPGTTAGIVNQLQDNYSAEAAMDTDLWKQAAAVPDSVLQESLDEKAMQITGEDVVQSTNIDDILDASQIDNRPEVKKGILQNAYQGREQARNYAQQFTN